MFTFIQLGQWTSYTPVSSLVFLDFLSSQQTKRIKEIAIHIFSRIAAFFKSSNQPSKEINIKAIAMIGCLSLVALFVISILRHNSRFVPPAHTRTPSAGY